MDLDFLQTLIRAIDESSLDSIEIERGGTRVRLSKTPQGTVVAAPPAVHAMHAPAPVPAPSPPGNPGPAPAGPAADVEAEAEEPEEESDLVDVTSPMVGTFYRAPAPDAPPYVERGDRVAKGDTLCIIEAMKLMNELEAEVTGTIREVLVDNAEPVEYGQVLFRIAPA
ncbi:MAG: acetyl-CoA carboxylase biotin carboxyl carrier protein [Gemmatimonadota bacterium]